jgi:Tfp pilus assembly protein PilV
MPAPFRKHGPGEESGYMLIEVVVSALLLVLVSLGVFKAFDAATRSTNQERARARAHSIAQADIARMRTMRISDLFGLDQTWNVTEDKQTYTVRSKAQILSDASGTASCEEGTASADYFKVSSTVTWTGMGSRPPVVAATLVAPPNGSVNPNTGALAVGVEDSRNVGIAGVGISGTGAGSFSGVTESNGCQIFGNLPAGNYTLTLSGIASGLVDVDGNPPTSKQTSVVAESTNTVVFQYDSPGGIPVQFQTRNYSNVLQPSSADSILVFNTGMTSARAFPGTPGARLSSITATSLFPFVSPYSVYAGSCVGDNPNPQELTPPPAPGAQAAVTVPPGTTVSPVTITLPALHVTVYSGTSTSSSRVSGATVKLWDYNCSFFARTFTTNSQGQLSDPGLPYTDYAMCVQAVISGSLRNKIVNLLSLNDPSDITGGTLNNVFMGTGTSSGACP